MNGRQPFLWIGHNTSFNPYANGECLFWKSEVIALMTLHNGKEMTNYCEEDDDDDIEWKLAMPKLSLKTDLKR